MLESLELALVAALLEVGGAGGRFAQLLEPELETRNPFLNPPKDDLESP